MFRQRAAESDGTARARAVAAPAGDSSFARTARTKLQPDLVQRQGRGEGGADYSSEIQTNTSVGTWDLFLFIMKLFTVVFLLVFLAICFTSIEGKLTGYSLLTTHFTTFSRLISTAS